MVDSTLPLDVDINQIATDLNNKADRDLSNTIPSDSFISDSVSWGMPDYANQITGSVASGTYVQVSQDSFVCVYGSDAYTEDIWCYVSPDNGTTTYIVGRRADDTNGNTESTSFTFLVPKDWYFTATIENGVYYHIYPLKGAN